MSSFMRTIVATVNVTLVVAPILALLLGPAPLRAQNPAPEYTVLVASGFLCDSGSCPAGAKSVNGDTYEITGAGTFNAQTKSVSAAGTFPTKSRMAPWSKLVSGPPTNSLVLIRMAPRRMRFGNVE